MKGIKIGPQKENKHRWSNTLFHMYLYFCNIDLAWKILFSKCFSLFSYLMVISSLPHLGPDSQNVNVSTPVVPQESSRYSREPAWNTSC